MAYIECGAFVGKPVDQLSDEERITYYRNLSFEALRKAQAAGTDEERGAFLDIALNWAAIARDVERLLTRKPECAGSLERRSGEVNRQPH